MRAAGVGEEVQRCRGAAHQRMATYCGPGLVQQVVRGLGEEAHRRQGVALCLIRVIEHCASLATDGRTSQHVRLNLVKLDIYGGAAPESETGCSQRGGATTPPRNSCTTTPRRPARPPRP